MKITDRWLQGNAWTLAARSLGRKQAIMRMRIVLGGLFMPLSLGGWCRRWMLLLLPIALGWAATVAGKYPGPAATSIGTAWQHGVAGFSCLWIQLYSLGVVSLAALQLRRHWHSPDHGLANLALLPGLGQAPQLHRDLLSAAIIPPLRWLLALGLIGLLASITATRGALAALLECACLLGNALTLITLALYTFSGRPLPSLALGLILASLAALSLLGFVLPGWLSHGGMIAAAAGIPFFGMLWLSHYGAMAWMILMGWANLFDRPHPFLPNP